jgi:hypothetical protein
VPTFRIENIPAFILQIGAGADAIRERIVIDAFLIVRPAGEGHRADLRQRTNNSQ